MTDKEFRQFNQLFKKFIDGSRWLENRKQHGEYVDLDKKKFYAVVVLPMEEMWEKFTEEECRAWEKVYLVVKIFDGKII